MRILHIEDDESLRANVKAGLKREGFAVDSVDNAKEGLIKIKEYQYDLILLDIGMPEMDGLSALKAIKSSGSTIPVFIISGQGGEDFKLKAFDLGAEDYMVKPFFLTELTARIRRELARHEKSGNVAGNGAEAVVGPIKLDIFKRRAVISGREIKLTPKEFMILEYLMRRAGRIVTQKALADACWDLDFETGTNVVEVHINRLRKKIDIKGKESLIQTVRQGGYMIDIPKGK